MLQIQHFAGFPAFRRYAPGWLPGAVSGSIAGVPLDDRLQGGVVLAREPAEIGIVAELADRKREVGLALLVVFLPDAADLDIVAAR